MKKIFIFLLLSTFGIVYSQGVFCWPITPNEVEIISGGGPGGLSGTELDLGEVCYCEDACGVRYFGVFKAVFTGSVYGVKIHSAIFTLKDGTYQVHELIYGYTDTAPKSIVTADCYPELLDPTTPHKIVITSEPGEYMSGSALFPIGTLLTFEFDIWYPTN